MLGRSTPNPMMLETTNVPTPRNGRTVGLHDVRGPSAPGVDDVVGHLMPLFPSVSRILAPCCGFCAAMVDIAVSVPENGSFALAARPDGGCRRTLHGIHGVVERMQGSAGFLDHLGCHRSFHGTTRVCGTTDTARNEQPGKETHLRLPRQDHYPLVSDSS